ncbi:MAG: hypothetical protein FVQ80_10660 [Planctomycetes bacterium]|nr:hypothetical protein [Planctomycetota bacterium]
MQLRNLIICLLALAIAVAMLIAAGSQLDYINEKRGEMKLISNTALENAPPSLAFATIAMGAFRGLVVDILWMRADKLKMEGQFFDAKQLAEWITTLQPRFAEVWDFHAWNMAYNISVAMPAEQPQERWRWVKNGYELLRDKGIPMNPKSILLYRSIAWIFQHKMGNIMDDAHKYYKLQLASMMEPLIGNTDNDFFDALAKSPTNIKQVINDPNIAPFIKKLKSSDVLFDDNDKLVQNYLALRQNPNKFAPNVFRVIDEFRGTEALRQFDTFAKAYELRNTWKMDPALMHKINNMHGPVDYDDPNQHLPLDWRHPDSHAIYWAVKGLEVAGQDTFTIAETNVDRIVIHSLQNLFRNGKIFIYSIPAPKEQLDIQPGDIPNDSPTTLKTVYLRKDLKMFDPYNNAVLAVLEKYKRIRGEKGAYKTWVTGHKNMLKNATVDFYLAGLLPKSKQTYAQLKELYPEPDWNLPLAIFVRNRIKDKLGSLGIHDAQQIIQSLLQEAYFRYAMRDDNECFGREQMAKEVYENYAAEFSDEERVRLPELKFLRFLALIDFLNTPYYPVNLRQSLIARIKIERPDLAEKFKQYEEKMIKEMEKAQQ